MFTSKVSGSCASRRHHIISMNVSGTPNYDFQISKLLKFLNLKSLCQVMLQLKYSNLHIGGQLCSVCV